MQIDAGNKESVCFGRWWLLSALVALIVVGCDVDLVVPLGETKMHANHPFPSPEEISKLPPDGGDRYNRLIFEKSPYLIQHATNPVDWYAWGAAAFEKAKREDKPIFLSIGYSTCHWCHVMETESFEDPEVAKLLNDHFVSIKVDREERPDIDSLYMAVTMALTGRGGWPMTCVLTPDKQPFFAGTYFPRESRFGMPGMLELLPKLAQAWEEQRDAVLKSAESIVAALRQDGQRSSSAQLDDAVLVQAYEGLAGLYDEMHCGFGSAPKFPSPGNLYFLLRHAYRSGDSKALAMVEGTLQAMRRGGIYDHVGFGFHRYATDRAWLVPHFEKMLYDQALLVLVYTEAFQVTGKQEYADTVREIATYVLRDMTSPEGGFYSAEDADSEGEEGKFYLWTRDAMAHVLGEEETQRFASLFGVGEAIPGWEEEGSILHETQSWADAASEAGVSESDLHHAWEQARVKLFNARELRIHPFKDDKILTDWNGLMIMALGKAGSVLHEPQFVQAAEKAADLVLARLRDDQGRLHHRMRQGEVGLPAHLEDYAYLAWGLIDLYEATFETEYLKAAVELTETQIALYWDGDAGGFFQSQESDDLLVRRKDAYDGAIPSGNAVAALNLLRLARMTGKPEWEEKAQALMTAFGEQVNRAPSGYTFLLSALAFAQGPSYEVVVAGRQGAQDTQAVLEKFSSVFAPNMVLLYRPTGEDVPAIAGLAEFTRYQEAIEGKATIYVCRNFTCERPTTDVQAALAIIQGRVP